MQLRLKVKPGAKLNRILIDANGNFLVRIKAPPIDGKANAELEKYLASILKIPHFRISVIGGLNGRHKKIEIEGLDKNEVEDVLKRSIM